jgi:putative membrane protein
MASPGPRSGRSALLLAVKGACMGAADTVPGVSGGTVALITGIYEDLLAAVKTADTRMIRYLLVFDFKEAIAGLHLRFLLCLFSCIGLAIMSLARLMNYLLNAHPVPIWSLFFGLIAASIWAVGRRVKTWSAGPAAVFCIGAAAAGCIVGLVPASTPDTVGFVFLSGMVAVCAMILPGLSGAFILLLLGKYEYVLGLVENPFLPANLSMLGVLAAGCVVGLAGFSRVLKYVLDTYPDLAVACLTGLMFGAMRKIWPWKEPLVAEQIHGKLVVITERNVWPAMTLSEVMLPAILMLVGFAAVVILERSSGKPPGQSSV